MHAELRKRRRVRDTGTVLAGLINNLLLQPVRFVGEQVGPIEDWGNYDAAFLSPTALLSQLISR